MKLGWQPRKWLEKKAKGGMRGYPVGTVAFYGPDDRRASKVAASIVPGPESEPAELRRWIVESGDIRRNDAVYAELAVFFRDRGVRTVIVKEEVFGCPHEEGIDYPEGEVCSQSPFWAGRDRWTGKLEET